MRVQLTISDGEDILATVTGIDNPALALGDLVRMHHMERLLHHMTGLKFTFSLIDPDKGGEIE